MRLFCVIILFFTMSNDATAQKYIFYLHGAIMEGQSGNAVSSSFGTYQYDAICDSFRKANFTVMSEVRKSNTDVRSYAKKVVTQIDSLISKGVPPNHITVIGASKGAMIAMCVSSFLKNDQVNFVFMAACNDGVMSAFPEINFCGNILSIYEKSDDIGASCASFKKKSSSSIPHYKEIEINTGLKHGFLFKPLPDWMKPAIEWANGNYN